MVRCACDSYCIRRVLWLYVSSDLFESSLHVTILKLPLNDKFISDSTTSFFSPLVTQSSPLCPTLPPPCPVLQSSVLRGVWIFLCSLSIPCFSPCLRGDYTYYLRILDENFLNVHKNLFKMYRYFKKGQKGEICLQMCTIILHPKSMNSLNNKKTFTLNV